MRREDALLPRFFSLVDRNRRHDLPLLSVRLMVGGIEELGGGSTLFADDQNFVIEHLSPGAVYRSARILQVATTQREADV
jgi:hypothetical protein